MDVVFQLSYGKKKVSNTRGPGMRMTKELCIEKQWWNWQRVSTKRKWSCYDKDLLSTEPMQRKQFDKAENLSFWSRCEAFVLELLPATYFEEGTCPEKTRKDFWFLWLRPSTRLSIVISYSMLNRQHHMVEQLDSQHDIIINFLSQFLKMYILIYNIF